MDGIGFGAISSAIRDGGNNNNNLGSHSRPRLRPNSVGNIEINIQRRMIDSPLGIRYLHSLNDINTPKSDNDNDISNNNHAKRNDIQRTLTHGSRNSNFDKYLFDNINVSKPALSPDIGNGHSNHSTIDTNTNTNSGLSSGVNSGVNSIQNTHTNISLGLGHHNFTSTNVDTPVLRPGARIPIKQIKSGEVSSGSERSNGMMNIRHISSFSTSSIIENGINIDINRTNSNDTRNNNTGIGSIVESPMVYDDTGNLYSKSGLVTPVQQTHVQTLAVQQRQHIPNKAGSQSNGSGIDTPFIHGIHNTDTYLSAPPSGIGMNGNLKDPTLNLHDIMSSGSCISALETDKNSASDINVTINNSDNNNNKLSGIKTMKNRNRNRNTSLNTNNSNPITIDTRTTPARTPNSRIDDHDEDVEDFVATKFAKNRNNNRNKNRNGRNSN